MAFGAASAILSIKILTDAKSAKSEFDKASKDVGKFGAGLKQAAVPAGIAIAAVGLFAKSAGDAASATQQAMGAVDSVFGKSAGQIKAWSDQSAKSVGLSKSQYGEMASVIGAQLRNMGIPMDQLAGKTNDLVTMGADLAATFGGSTAEAVEALGSALRGETDPIERYGISIKQADIAARQAKDGTDKLTGAAGKQAKTAALLSLVTEQAGGAMGQFARETDSAAGSQQIATAQWQDAKSALGTALLPAMSTLAGILGSLAKLIQDHATLFGVLVGVIAAVAAAVLVLNAGVSIYTLVVTLAGEATAKAWLAALGPIGLVIAAVLAVVAIVLLLWHKFPPFRNAVIAVWNAIRNAATAVAAWIKAAWMKIWPPLSAALNIMAGHFKAVFGVIKAVVRLVAAAIGLAFRVAFAVIRAVAAPVIALLKAGFNALKPIITSIANLLRGPLGAAFRWLGNVARQVGSILAGAFDKFLSFLHTITGAVDRLTSALSRIKVPKISLPFGLGGGSSRSVAAPALAPVGAAAARGLAAPMARVGAGSSGGGVTVNVYGALDPEATARQIQRVLSAHNRRMGLSGAGLRAGVV